MKNANTPDIFKHLESDYTGGNYDSVIDGLLEHKEQFDLGKFHFNLGTVYAKKGDFAIGRFHYEKALHHGFYSSKVHNNLSHAKQQLGLQELSFSKAPGHFFFEKLNSIPKEGYHFISLAILLIVLLLFRFKQNFKIKSLVIGCFIAILPYGLYQSSLRKVKFAVLLKDIEIHEGPSAIYPVSNKGFGGEKVRVLETKKDWFYLAFPNNKYGWALKDHIGII